MTPAARAFAMVDLAVASRLHMQGVDIGGVESQQLLELANRAQFEHLVTSGATVQVIRSLDRRHWCPVVLVPGGVGSVCRGSVLTVPSVVKKRRATCPQCLAAFEV